MIRPNHSRSHRVNRYGVTIFTLIVSLVATGCSSTVNPSEKPSETNGSSNSEHTTLGVEEAREKAKTFSSQIYELIGIKDGKVSELGPSISPCKEDPDHSYRTVHPWSVYDVTENELKDGFQRLKKGLPTQGWKNVEYGPNGSKDKTLQITADAKTEPFSLNAELWVSSDLVSRE